MHACDNAIGLEYKEVSMISGFHHGAIITRPDEHIGPIERAVRARREP